MITKQQRREIRQQAEATRRSGLVRPAWGSEVLGELARRLEAMMRETDPAFQTLQELWDEGAPDAAARVAELGARVDDVEAIYDAMLTQLTAVRGWLAYQPLAGMVELTSLHPDALCVLAAEERDMLDFTDTMIKAVNAALVKLRSSDQKLVAPARSAPRVFENGWGSVPTYKGLLGALQSVERGTSGDGWTDNNGQTAPERVAYTDVRDGRQIVLSMRDLSGERTPPSDVILRLWQTVKAMNDLTSDVLLYCLCRWLRLGSKPNDWFWISANAVLDERGVKRIAARDGENPNWQHGHRPEDRRDVGRAIGHLRGLWLHVADVEMAPAKGKRRKPITVRVDDPLLHMGTRISQAGFEGEDVFVAARVQIGEWGPEFVKALGPQYGPIAQKALEYNPYKERPEKRLAKYLAFHLRINDGAATVPRHVGTLLEGIGSDALRIDERNPERTRTRLHQALDALARDCVIARWEYSPDQPELPPKKWLGHWLEHTVRIYPPVVPQVALDAGPPR